MTLHIGDCRVVLPRLIAEGVKAQMCVTSPPYWGLRDYGTAEWSGGDPECAHIGAIERLAPPGTAKQASNRGTVSVRSGDCLCGATRIDKQLGLEPTPDAYVANMVQVFRYVRDLLADDGTLWLNLGDSYAAAMPCDRRNVIGNGSPDDAMQRRSRLVGGLKNKDLVGIPWRVAFALQADGWVLRQEIIWAKPNPMPESVTDRCTKSHESLFLFAKAKWSGPQPGRFAHISDEDARWLALCIDTEGCIVVKRVKQNDGGADTFGPQVTFGGTHRGLVERFAAIVGHGNVAERPGTNAPMLYWQLGNNIARDFLHRIYPYLIVKQRQARIGIHVDDLVYYRGGQLPARKQRTAAENDRLISLWARNKLCNRFGDPDLSDVPEPAFGRWVDCQRYYYDAAAIAEPVSASMLAQMEQGYDGAATKDYAGAGAQDPSAVKARILSKSGNKERKNRRDYGGNPDHPGAQAFGVPWEGYTRNKRSVWTVTTKPYAEAHFATFPPELIEPCIMAGSRPNDVVLDPFFGSGTVGEVCQNLGRRWLGVELNPQYERLARDRTAQLGMVL